MKLVACGWPWIMGAAVVFGVPAWIAFQVHAPRTGLTFLVLAAIGALFMAYFFRNPDRLPPPGEANYVSGADGLIRAVEEVDESKYLQCKTVRISVFLSPLDVHVNRAPMAGTIRKLEYVRGRHLLTFDNASSDVNQHSSILIEGDGMRCLVKQITGPIVRRVVYWLTEGQAIDRAGVIGMMKFGSRMDVYFPAGTVDVLVKKGDRVRAGETVIARRRP